MKPLTLKNLADIIDACVIGGSHAIRDTQYAIRVSTDSRSVNPGDCFFAIKGDNFDGHNFIEDAFAKGALCAVVEKDISPDQFPDRVILKVDDTVKALGQLAAWYRSDCNFKVIAITGSVGKTTTRQILYAVLGRRFRVHQSPKNYNNFVGLPLSILSASPDDEVLILELATNKPGEIEYLSKIASPDIAIITNVHPAHLAGFGSVENIAVEKLDICTGLRPSGKLIINSECQTLLDAAKAANLSFRTFSTNDADYRAGEVSIGPLTSSFTIDDVTVSLPLPGRGNVENALAAWSVCSLLGISASDFADAAKTISAVSMRTELLQLGPLTVINDCYNANPASMKNALDILTSLAAGQNRHSVFICGDMAELGDSAQSLHRQLGRDITQANVQLLITVGPLAALAAESAKITQTHCFADSTELCDNLRNLIKDADIILVKGSRINKLELVVDKLKEFFCASRTGNGARGAGHIRQK